MRRGREGKQPDTPPRGGVHNGAENPGRSKAVTWPPEKPGVAEFPQSRGVPRTAGSWPAPRPRTLQGNADTDNPPKNRSLGAGIPELCGNLMFSFSLALKPQVWIAGAAHLVFLRIILGTEGMSLVHPGAGLGRSNEACHLTCYHCFLSLGKREAVS